MKGAHMGVKGPEVAWAQEWLLRVVTGSGYCEWLPGVVTADMGVERPFPPYPS